MAGEVLAADASSSSIDSNLAVVFSCNVAAKRDKIIDGAFVVLAFCSFWSLTGLEDLSAIEMSEPSSLCAWVAAKIARLSNIRIESLWYMAFIALHCISVSFQSCMDFFSETTE